MFRFFLLFLSDLHFLPSVYPSSSASSRSSWARPWWGLLWVDGCWLSSATTVGRVAGADLLGKCCAAVKRGWWKMEQGRLNWLLPLLSHWWWILMVACKEQRNKQQKTNTQKSNRFFSSLNLGFFRFVLQVQRDCQQGGAAVVI